jgi:hypothetical protein
MREERPKANPVIVLLAVREIVHDLDSEVGLYNIATFDQIDRQFLSRRRLYATLLGIFSVFFRDCCLELASSIG